LPPAGTVLKRFDTTKLFALACQDVVERFHLMLILAFVLVEEMSNRWVGGWVGGCSMGCEVNVFACISGETASAASC
jgi:phosphoribosylaminoimidazole (AIR) synthetase